MSVFTAATPTPGEAAAFIIMALESALKPAAEALPLAIPGTQAHRTLAERVSTLERALIIARESGVLITAEGEPVAALLDDLFEAMPTPKTEKLSVPWQRALKQARRPRYRWHDATVTVTDTLTGLRASTVAPGPVAAARRVFAQTDTGAHVTPAGVGVCGRNEADAVAFLITAGR